MIPIYFFEIIKISDYEVGGLKVIPRHVSTTKLVRYLNESECGGNDDVGNECD